MEIDLDQLLLGDWPQRHKILALGSNLPVGSQAPLRVLQHAIASLGEKGLTVYKRSRFYRTPCVPSGAGPDYVNAAVVVSTDASAENLLATIHEIEADYGRIREERWGSRGLDIDLIGAGDLILPDRNLVQHWMDMPFDQQRRKAPNTLILPHPRLHERAFVLVPLADVAPDWRHPVLDLSVVEMRDRLPHAERHAIVALD